MAKTPKRPRDPAQLAKLVVDIATGEASDEVESQELTEAQKFARSGGKVGGAARARALSPERRAEIAKKAAKTRWKRGS